MSFDADKEDDKQWSCGNSVSLHLVSSIVRDIGDPCLHQSTAKGNKMLKPERWQAAFDTDGKVSGFGKVLKSITLGGVDPSIRAEVWEFLLGCYALSSTTEYRRQLRIARKERYTYLVKQCQMMHSSIGTGSLAYVVGSKVMDVRNLAKDISKGEAEVKCKSASLDVANNIEAYCEWDNDCTDNSYTCQRESGSNSADLMSVRGSTNSLMYHSSCAMCSSRRYSRSIAGRESQESQLFTESYFDFPSLPVTDLFKESEKDSEGCGGHDKPPKERRSLDDNVHCFQINNNVDLIIESNGSLSKDVSCAKNSVTKLLDSKAHDQVRGSPKLEHKTEIDRLRISDVPDPATVNVRTSQEESANDDRVSEWLWTLHQIVVDVVRTDSHLEFYEDTKNVARMSDILAVYAWVDPATGYCQGMSDLLSPFVVLYKDDADAFWCFEMLLRKMRENFQMEGPMGVMKQLQVLWKVLETVDKEMFAHFRSIEAESLHFAFRMLLVLFRRELSFNEALCMWEMMWAADFDESIAQELDDNCLEALQLPRDSLAEVKQMTENDTGSSRGYSQSKGSNVERSMSDNIGLKSALGYPFCGLTRGFWSKKDHLHMSNIVSATRKGDDEMPIFCVAAILMINRQRIMKGTHSIDDLIKMFNDNMLMINIKRCISTAIKLRKKYIYKVVRDYEDIASFPLVRTRTQKFPQTSSVCESASGTFGGCINLRLLTRASH